MTAILIGTYIVSLIYEYAGINVLFGAVFQKKEQTKILIYALAISLQFACIYFSFYVVMFPNVPLIICMFLFGLVLLMNYEGSLLGKLLICFLNYTCMIISESIGGIIICAIANIPIAHVRENETPFILAVVLMRLLYYAVVRMLTMFIKRKQIRFKTNIMIAFLVIFVIFTMILMILYYIAYHVDNPQVEMFIILAATIFILAIYILVIILDRLYEERIKNERLMLLEYQVESQKEHYEELYHANIETRKIYHDLKNTLIAVDGMLKSKQYEPLSQYIDSMYSKTKKRDNMINTGFLPIDSILSAKMKHAAEEGIKIESEIVLPEVIKVDLIELSIVIANLLDNGIEAVTTLSSEKRKIKFQLRSHGNYIAIQTENETDNQTFVGICKTTKFKKEVHGYGLQSVREIVEKYDGTMDIYCNSGLFKLQLMIKNDTFDSK